MEPVPETTTIPVPVPTAARNAISASVTSRWCRAGTAFRSHARSGRPTAGSARSSHTGANAHEQGLLAAGALDQRPPSEARREWRPLAELLSPPARVPVWLPRSPPSAGLRGLPQPWRGCGPARHRDMLACGFPRHQDPGKDPYAKRIPRRLRGVTRNSVEHLTRDPTPHLIELALRSWTLCAFSRRLTFKLRRRRSALHAHRRLSAIPGPSRSYAVSLEIGRINGTTKGPDLAELGDSGGR